MIRTTRAARHLVAALAAVLFLGVLGVVSAAAFARVDGPRTASGVADTSGAPHQQRATVAAPEQDHATITLDLTTPAAELAVPLLLSLAFAVALAAVAGRAGNPLVPAPGRGPPAA